MAIVWRQTKGSPLTSDELDQNFLELDQRLAALEKGAGSAEGLARVEQEGDWMIFLGTRGSVLGKVRIPRAPFRPAGPWKSMDIYQPGDVVQHKNTLFLCRTTAVREEFAPEDWDTLFSLDA